MTKIKHIKDFLIDKYLLIAMPLFGPLINWITSIVVFFWGDIEE